MGKPLKTDFWEPVLQAIENEMEEKKIGVSELAEYADISPSTIRRLLNRENALFSSLIKTCLALGIRFNFTVPKTEDTNEQG